MTPLYVKIAMFILSQGFFFAAWGRSNWLVSLTTGSVALASTVFLAKEIYEEFIAPAKAEIAVDAPDCADPDADWSHAAQENTCYAIRAYLRRHGASQCYAAELASGRRGGLCQAYDAERARLEERERQRRETIEAARRRYACETDSGAPGVSFGQKCWPLDTTNIRSSDIPYTVRRAITDASPLSGLTGLRELNLSRTRVSDVTALSGLTGLRELDLGGTRVSDVTALSGLTGLRELDLSSTEVSDITALSGLTGLQELWLHGTEVSDVTALPGLTGLHYLSMRNGIGVGGWRDQDNTPANRAAVARAIREWRPAGR